MHLNNLDKDIEKIKDTLDNAEGIQSKCLTHMRECVRAAGRSIISVHSGNFRSALKFLSLSKKNLALLKNECISANHVFDHYLFHSEQEYSEAVCLYSIVVNHTLPPRAEIGVSEVAYLNSLCDLIGELRRYMLNLLISGKLDFSKQIFFTMEQIFSAISILKYSDSIAPEFRRKTDVARIQVEQARSELFIAEIKLK